MRVRFWGTRGSIAKPGANTLRYGGNTSCVEVQTADTLVVLDCGTGAYELGQALARAGSGGRGHLLIGHTHWDHIQGFPFFDPLFMPGGHWDVYAPAGRGRDVEAALAAQMSYQYSPITLDALNAEVRLRDLGEGCFELGGIRVTTQYLNHPALTLGYRLEAEGATLVYATDHEPHSLHPCAGLPGTPPVHHEDRRHVRFLEGADLLIHDAQYTLEDFPDKVGWGHTPTDRAVDYAMLARAKRLALFHHDPARSDEGIDRVCELARDRSASGKHSLEIFAAAEGQVIELTGDFTRASPPLETRNSALLSGAPRPAASVLVVDDDPDMLALLEAALRPEGVRVWTARDGESALRLARKERPTLIVLDLSLPGHSGLEVCQRLRDEPDPSICDIPILILTGTKLEEKDVVEAFVAGATDYLTKPIKPTLLRSRVRGWLLRTASD
jgi:CheY-like chemotaxis protein